MKKKATKASVLAAIAIFLSTSVALGQTVDTSQRQANVTVVPETVKAPPVSRRDKRLIEATIRTQLQALHTGDAVLAFANLAPSAQSQFGAPGVFLDSVAQDTPPIVEAVSYSFLSGVRQRSGEVMLPVLLTDKEGRSWIANFGVERQPAGDWRIKSCVVKDMVGQQA
jgi:Domain of unknown function (DUF4864)